MNGTDGDSLATRERHPVVVACDRRDAAGFVHCGTRSDPTIRFLTDYDGRGAVGIVVTDDRRVVLAPEPDRVGRPPEVPRATETVAVDDGRDATVRQVADRLAALLPDSDGTATDAPTVLAPAHVPHDLALFVENAGAALASTDAVDRARERTTPDQRARIERAAGAAVAGLERAAARLAAVDPDDPPTVRDLRTAVDAAVAGAGGDPAENTRIGVHGPSASADAGASPIPPATTVTVSVAPRVEGYHAPLTRTFVVDGAGGWDRRAHVAVRAAREAALATLAAGESVATATTEARAEVSAYGLDPTGDAVCGVGLEPRERPLPGDGDPVEPGTVLRVAPGATGSEGRVVLGDLVRCTEDGVERLVSLPDALDPGRW